MKGILFKPDMHKAIREGRKTVTRRLSGLKEINKEPDRWGSPIAVARDFKPLKAGDWIWQDLRDLSHNVAARPRYHVGEFVYVKEAYHVHKTAIEIIDGLWRPVMFYKARDTISSTSQWCSPLFMPAWAARDFLKIVDVRPERLQDITPEDCIKEGITRDSDPNLPVKYRVLWDSINHAYPWLSNPWVFRYEFEPTGRPEGM